MMPKLRQRSAKSTLGVPKASFAQILLNFGRFGVAPGILKGLIRVILGGIFRFGVSFWGLVGAKGVPKSIVWTSRCAKSRKNDAQDGVLEKA